MRELYLLRLSHEVLINLFDDGLRQQHVTDIRGRRDVRWRLALLYAPRRSTPRSAAPLLADDAPIGWVVLIKRGWQKSDLKGGGVEWQPMKRNMLMAGPGRRDSVVPP